LPNLAAQEEIRNCGSLSQNFGQHTIESQKYLATNNFLPVYEDWSSGSFGPLWSADTNWIINTQYGNDAPSAEFKWEPLQQNYQRALTSDSLNGVSMNSAGNPYVDGSIMLSFDLKLDNVLGTGFEELYVEVYDGGDWNRIVQYSNKAGGFNWTHFDIDISQDAMGNIFVIRFIAQGVNSASISSWFIDNISIYHYCAASPHIEAYSINPDTIKVMWEPPQTGQTEEWIFWDNGNNDSGVGLTDGGRFKVASRWLPGMISQYEGMYITKISIYPHEDTQESVFILKVWEGDSAESQIYEQMLYDVNIDEWNEITLSTPVAIDVSKELWFGYEIICEKHAHPAGLDSGPALTGYGDMVAYSDTLWFPVSTYAPPWFDGNWNLRALIRDLDNKSGWDSKSVQGYTLYHSLDGLGEYLDYTTDTAYNYHVIEDGLHCFWVTSMYESCESQSSDTACVPTPPLGFVEDPYGKEIIVYPNPANGFIHINSPRTIHDILLLDPSGCPLVHKHCNQNKHSLDVSTLSSGVYLIRINTEGGRYIRKVIVE
jgi:hypothetical protein